MKWRISNFFFDNMGYLFSDEGYKWSRLFRRFFIITFLVSIPLWMLSILLMFLGFIIFGVAEVIVDAWNAE